MCRAELQDEIEHIEKLERGTLLLTGERFDELDGGRRAGRRLAQVCGKRLHAIGSLYPLDVLDIVRPEQLRAIEDKGEVRFRAEHTVDALGRFPFPLRPGEQVLPAAVAGDPGADVGEVVGIEVNELRGVVTALLHRRHRQYQRFGAQVGAQARIRCIRVGRLHGLVVWRADAGIAMDLVPGPFVLRILAIHEIGILDAVVIHRRIAVDVRFLGNGTHFLY
ncbi:hypothetical protein D3C81_1022310 [compost metagenome]